VSLALDYLGWSGFRIDWAGGPTLFVDPPDADLLPRECEVSILLSHGHPEHVQGTAAHLAAGERAPVAVVASPQVCRHLQQRCGRDGDRFQPAAAGEDIALAGLSLRPFAWRHMPLVPPEPKLAVRHIARLATHPRTTFGIVRDGLVGPRPGSMLGYRLEPDSGPRILLYSEGLHRRTRRAELREALAGGSVEVLVFAFEPEDADALPDLVAAVGAPVAVPFEAHRGWRAELGMPQADLPRLSRELAARGITARALAGGERLLLSQEDLRA
jgi:hypothetical protein